MTRFIRPAIRPMALATALLVASAGLTATPANAAETRTVLTTGDIRLASTLAGEALSLGIVDNTDPANPVELSPETTVFHVDAQDTAYPWGTSTSPTNSFRTRMSSYYVPDGGFLWRTAGSAPANETAPTNAERFGENRDFRITLDAGRVSSAETRSGVRYSLGSVTAPEGGRYVSYRSASNGVPYVGRSPLWDSAAETNDGVEQLSAGDGAALAAAVSPNPQSGDQIAVPSGWLFNTPGVYCVTLRSSANLTTGGYLTAHKTFTVAVGEAVDPQAIDLCAQDDNPAAEPNAGFDDTVTYLRNGHLDLGAEWNSGKTALQPFVGDTGKSIALNDAVIVLDDAYGKQTVPTDPNLGDYSFIGPPGSTYWKIDGGGAFQDHSPRLGISFERLSTADPQYEVKRSVNTTLKGVRGPGEVVIYYQQAATQQKVSQIWFSTKYGLPESRAEQLSHIHMDWAFTQKGVYCLNFAWDTRKAIDGSKLHTEGLLTVAAGLTEDELKQVQPCGRDTATPAPVGVPKAAPAVAYDTDDTATQVVDSGSVKITPYLEDGGLHVSAGLRGFANNQAIVYRDPEALVLYGPRATLQGQGNDSGGARRTAETRWVADRILPDQIVGDIKVTLGEVQGPGRISINEDLTWADKTMLSDATEDSPRSYQLWPGWDTRWIITRATVPGVYCVPLTWSVVPTGASEPMTTTTVLTYVLDSDDGGEYDPSTVTPCAQGGTGTDPGDEDPGNDDEAWRVANGSTTAAGSIVLNDGHVDLSSQVTDGVLDTVIKDSTAAGPAHRSPAETVLQLLPATRTQVPDTGNDLFTFLGRPGSPLWQVNQSQAPDVLWPGWSTEEIPQNTLNSSTGVIWTLKANRGPGDFFLYQDGDITGRPTVRFNSANGIDTTDSFEISQNMHAHGYWAFTAEGVYCLDFNRSATLQGGASVSDDFTLAVAVGRTDVTKVDAGNCQPAEYLPAEPEPMALRPVVLDQGHIDLFELTYDKDHAQLDLRAKDDTKLYDLDVTYREPETVSIAVDSEQAAFSLEEIPPGYDFLGPAGRVTYLLDWTQQEGLPWPGWSTERLVDGLPAGVSIPDRQDAVRFAVDVTGPGDVFAFIPGDNGPENKFIDTTDDQPDVIETGPSIHYHTSWVFTEPGDYELKVTPSATTTTGATLTGPAKSYHVHVGPRPALAQKTDAAEFGATITGVPESVGDDTPVDLTLELTGDHPEVAGYQWYRWIDGQRDVKIAGATGTAVSTTVKPWDLVYAAVLDDTGRILTVAYASFMPVPSAPTAPHNVNAYLDGTTVTVSWATPNNGGSPITSYIATLTPESGTPLTQSVDGQSGSDAVFHNVPAGTWTATIRAINAYGEGPESEPSSAVTVTAAPGPDPEPTPSPEPTPTPDPSPSPDPTPTPSPDPTPSPNPDPGAVATTITAPAIAQTYGKTATLAVTVSPSATGQVKVRVGSKTVTGILVDGQATLTLPKKALKPGTRTITITYAGVADAFQPATATATVTVAKAKPTVKVTRVKSTVKRGRTATFKVTVAASGVKPTGKVTVTIAGKHKTVKLNSKGKATVKVTLPRSAKVGKKKVAVSYGGNTYVAKATKNTTMKVTR